MPEVFDLPQRAGLRFACWAARRRTPRRQRARHAPHGDRAAALAPAEQHAALELIRGTMMRHSAIAHATGDALTGLISVGPSRSPSRPRSRSSTAFRREPQGPGSARPRRHHLVSLIDAVRLRRFRSSTGESTVDDLGGAVGSRRVALAAGPRRPRRERTRSPDDTTPQMTPSSFARRAASRRVATSSRCRIAATWDSTVRTET